MTAPEALHRVRVRDVVGAVAILVFGLGWWNSETKATTAVATNLVNLSEIVKTLQDNQKGLVVHVQEIDTKGTQGSQATSRLAEERNNEQDRRLNIMDDQLKTIIPDLREIKTKMNFMADLMDGQSKGHK